MKKRAFIFITILCGLSAFAQSPQGELKHFAKDDLSFDYPVGWTLMDKSTPQAQHLTIVRPGGSEMIMIIAYRELVKSFAQFQVARDQITVPYIESVAQRFGSAGKPAEREFLCTEVSPFNKSVGGLRVRGSFNQQPSTGEFYSFLMRQRFVNLIYIRMDKDAAQGDPVWETVRRTLKIESANPTTGQEDESASWLKSDVASGGVLNGKALSLPRPEYTSFARGARAVGTVAVEVTIDEKGEVISSRAVTGHPLLRPAGEEAAKRARFSPTTICGKPVKVTGIINYNFVAM
jgi:TonB family protein